MGVSSPARRQILRASLIVPASVVLARLRIPPSASASDARNLLEATPACDDDPTPSAIEGPFFKPNSPARTSLLDPDAAGTRVILTGRVLATDCQPVPGALLDFWHADSAGEYDNVAHRLRGHQFSDAQGRYRLETILPGGYGGRTRHFHVKLQAPNQPVLTTQLFFPGEPRNARDFAFRPQLLVTMADARGGKAAGFDFVLALG